MGRSKEVRGKQRLIRSRTLAAVYCSGSSGVDVIESG